MSLVRADLLVNRLALGSRVAHGSAMGSGGSADWKNDGAETEQDRSHVFWALWRGPSCCGYWGRVVTDVPGHGRPFGRDVGLGQGGQYTDLPQVQVKVQNEKVDGAQIK